MWKPVVGYEGLYEVSDAGEVRSHYTNKVLKLNADSSGHLYVRLYKAGAPKNYSVHRLVLSAFVGPRPRGKVCCHGPLGKSNNAVGNLSYGTILKNNSDDRNRDNKYSSRYPGVSLHKLTGKWQAEFRGKYLGLFEDEIDAYTTYKKARDICESQSS